jgi:hypothetical protein
MKPMVTGTVITLALACLFLWGLVRLLEPNLAFFPTGGEQMTPADHGLAFTPLDVQTSDGERLRAWWIPRDPPLASVVFFHGNGGNLSLWSPVFAELHHRGYAVLAWDYRGYGSSTGRPSERGLYRDAEAIVGLVKERGLERGGAPLVYWGRSLGTAVAAYAASVQAPDGLVLEAGFPSARALFEGNPLMRLLSLFSSYRFPTADWMERVQVPALVIHGTADSVIPFRMGERLYGGLRGKKRFHAIPGGDHNDLSPRDGEAYWEAVRAFVAELAARASGSRQEQGRGTERD